MRFEDIDKRFLTPFLTNAGAEPAGAGGEGHGHDDDAERVDGLLPESTGPTLTLGNSNGSGGGGGGGGGGIGGLGGAGGDGGGPELAAVLDDTSLPASTPASPSPPSPLRRVTE